MKCDRKYRQVDLFDSDAYASRIPPCLQKDLIDALSHLLWQVASAQVVASQGGEDEQDRS